MNSYGQLEALLKYAPALIDASPVNTPLQLQPSASLESFIEGKSWPLRWILEQISAEIVDRTALHKRVLASISQQYCYLKTKVYELDAWGLGHNRNIDSRRSRLEQQLDALNQEARQEQVKRWQDIATLKREFRTWFKQYADLTGRMRLIMSPRKSVDRSPPPELAKILHL